MAVGFDADVVAALDAYVLFKRAERLVKFKTCGIFDCDLEDCIALRSNYAEVAQWLRELAPEYRSELQCELLMAEDNEEN